MSYLFPFDSSDWFPFDPSDWSPLSQIEAQLDIRNGRILELGAEVALAVLDDRPIAIRIDGPRAGYYGDLVHGGPCLSLSDADFLREVEGLSDGDVAKNSRQTLTLAEGEQHLRMVFAAVLQDIRPQILALLARDAAEQASRADADADADAVIVLVKATSCRASDEDRLAVIDAIAPLLDLDWDRRPGPLWEKLVKALGIEPSPAAASDGEAPAEADGHTAMAHLVLATPGLGKTRSMVELIETLPETAVVWVFQPTLKKAEEFARDMAAASSRPVEVFRGRGARVRQGAQERMCARHGLAGSVAAAGYSVRQALCGSDTDRRGRCVHAPGCAYLGQLRRLQTHAGGGVFVLTHASLTQPPPVPRPHLVLVDEDPSATLPLETRVEVSALGVTGAWSALLPDEDEADASRLPALYDDQFHVLDEDEAGEAPNALLDMFDRLVEGLSADQPLAVLSELIEVNELEAAQKVLRRIERKIQREIGPQLNDEAVVEDHLAMSILSELQKVQAILGAILREVRLFNDGAIDRSSFNGLSLGRDDRGGLSTVTAHGLAPLAIPPGVPMIVLDGTADPVLLGCALRRRQQVWRIDLQRQGEVVQCLGRSFSNRSLVPDPRYPADNTTGDHDQLWPQIEGVLRREIASAPGGVLVVSTLAAEIEARRRGICDDLAEDRLAWTHFGATRGINAFTERQTLVLLGRRQPPAQAVEAVARAFFAGDPEPFEPEAQGYVVRHRRLYDKAGGAHPTMVQVHPDPRAQRVLWQMREAEAIQALDRVRAVRFPRRIVMLSALNLHRPDDDLLNPALGLPADDMRSWPELRNGGNRAEVILATSGFLPAAPRLLAKIADEIFPGVEAAKKWLQRTDLQAALARHAGHLHDVEIRPEGQRGRTCRLLLDRRHHASLAAARSAFEAATGMKMAVWIPRES